MPITMLDPLHTLLATADIERLHTAYRSGETSVTAVVRFYLDRINATNSMLHAVIATNPNASDVAAGQDRLLNTPDASLPALFGIPLLIKDNIETAELPTTAGALVLADIHTGRDAGVVARLRAAGAIILGKSNLSEWANFRDLESISGWSAVGGQCVNAFDPLRSPAGSSSGSAVGVAALLCHAAIGTETCGSIVSPATFNGVVGLKPTGGRLPGDGIVPISVQHDTAGPITRNVADAARLLTVLEGPNATTARVKQSAPPRLGLPPAPPLPEPVLQLRADTVALLGQYATVLPVGALADENPIMRNMLRGMMFGFEQALNQYLDSLPDKNTTPSQPAENQALTLKQIVGFNEAQRDVELALFGQRVFEAACSGKLNDNGQPAAAAAALAALDAAFGDHSLNAIIQLTAGTASLIDAPEGDSEPWWDSALLPAASGFPHITLPIGLVGGLPVGLSLIGRPNCDHQLLETGAHLERMLNLPTWAPALRVYR